MSTTPHSSGFTLVETLVVIAILSMVGLALTSAIQYFYRGNAYVFEETAAVDSARNGLAVALHDLREASYGDDGAYPISDASASAVTIYADIDNDGAVDKVRLYLNGATLYRGVTKSAGYPPSYAGQAETTSTLATYVSNAANEPLFTYYDANGAVLAAPINASAIRSVAVLLKVDINPKRAPNIFTLLGSATLRNVIN